MSSALLTPDAELARNETNLRQIELAITRRLDGLLHGDHQALLPGPGSEAGDGRLYAPGDDARRIDWNLTARSGNVHVRDTIAERELETWVVADASASLDFGTASWEKRDLALVTAATFGLLADRAGNRTGAVVFDTETTTIVPPRAGRAATMEMMRRIDRAGRRDRAPAARAGTLTLADALHRTAALARRRGRVVVVSDLIDDSRWADELRALGARHQIVVAEVSDPREAQLPAVGLLTLVDPESGRRIEVQTSNRKLRERFSEAASARQTANAGAIRSAGARHLRLSTDRDWMHDIVRFAAMHSARLGRAS